MSYYYYYYFKFNNYVRKRTSDLKIISAYQLPLSYDEVTKDNLKEETIQIQSTSWQLD